MVKKKEYATSIKTGKKEEIKDNTKIATAEGTIVHNPTETKNTTEIEKPKTTISKNIEKEQDERTGFQKVMDTISAPLSQPRETFKNGLKAGSEAVAESREKIQSGDRYEAGKVIGQTVLSTAVTAAALLTADKLISTALTKLTAFNYGYGASYGTATSPGATITVNGVKSSIAKIAGTKNWNFARVANNAKSFAMKKTILQKITATATNPRVVLGLIASTVYTSLFWAPNEKGDALTTLTITQANALKNGDAESVREINNLIQETQEISASIPVVGFIEAEKAKFAAAAKASETYMKEAEALEAENARIQAQGGTDEDLKYQKIREESEARDKQSEIDAAQKREDDEKYYNDIEEKNKEEKLRVAQIMQEVYRLRREKKYDEADALELTAYQ